MNSIEKDIENILNSMIETLHVDEYQNYYEGISGENTGRAAKELFDFIKPLQSSISIFDCAQGIHQVGPSGKCINCGIEFTRVILSGLNNE